MKDTQPLVSVIMPIYNGEKFLETAIQSIYRQMQPWIEIILINDGSTDRTEQICKKYVADNIVYKSIENSGAGHARNVGINIAKGDWILFLDSDDLILDGFFCRSLYYYLKDCLQEHTDIICMPMTYCDMRLSKKPRVVYPQKIEQISHYMPELEFVSCLYRKNYLKKKVYFFEYRKQDIESAFRFRAFSNTKGIKVDNRRAFYIYRENLASNTHTWNPYNYYEIKAVVYHELFQEFNNPDRDTAVWLYMQYLFHAKELFLGCLRKGGNQIEQTQVKTVLERLRQSGRPAPVQLMPINYKIFYFCAKLFNNKFFWKLYTTICNKKSYSSVIENNDQQKKSDNTADDIEFIFSQMEKYKKSVIEQLQSHQSDL